MKRIAIAFLVCSVLLGSATAQEYASWTNLVTLNPYAYSTTYDALCMWVEDGTVQTLGLYLYDPENPSWSINPVTRPVEFISQVDFGVGFTDGATVLAWSAPPGTTITETAAGLRIVYDPPLQVVEDPMLLANVDVLFDSEGHFEPAEFGISRCEYNDNVHSEVFGPVTSPFPFFVTFQDAEDTDGDPVIMAQTGYHQQFAVYAPDDVAADAPTFDALKALYR